MDELKRYSDSSNSGEEEHLTKKKMPSTPESYKEHYHSSRRDRSAEHSRSRHHDSNRSKRRSRSRSHDRNRSRDHDRLPRAYQQRRQRSPPRRRRFHSPEHHHQKSSSSDHHHGNRSRSGSTRDDVERRKMSPLDNGKEQQPTETTKDDTGPLQGPVDGASSKPVVQPPTVHSDGGIPPPLPVVSAAPVLLGGSVPASTTTQLTTEQQIEQAVAAAQALARSSLPTYINPTAMNPSRFQTLQEKKKKLWSAKKKDAPSHNQWEKVSFGGQGQVAQAKFRRLMGISKEKDTSDSAATESHDPVEEEHTKRLSALEEQYESSRYLTHIARGAGLGYGTTATAPTVVSDVPPATKTTDNNSKQ